MAISPHDIRARQFATVKRGGYDQREVEAFRTAAAEALEAATQNATAMEARARAAVARLQALQEQAESAGDDAGQRAEPVAAATAAPAALPYDEAEAISRTLLLAQRTADSTIADAEREANERRANADAEAAQIVDSAKAESRKAGEAERARVEGEVQALLARRDFLESDVDQLEQFLAAQRDRITNVAAELAELTNRVGNGLGDVRRPQLSASDNDHSGEVDRDPGDNALDAGDDAEEDAEEDAEDEADIAELIEQVSSESGEGNGDPDERDQRHTLFGADESR